VVHHVGWGAKGRGILHSLGLGVVWKSCSTVPAGPWGFPPDPAWPCGQRHCRRSSLPAPLWDVGGFFWPNPMLGWLLVTRSWIIMAVGFGGSGPWGQNRGQSVAHVDWRAWAWCFLACTVHGLFGNRAWLIFVNGVFSENTGWERFGRIRECSSLTLRVTKS
jgi:hypothetical protein